MPQASPTILQMGPSRSLPETPLGPSTDNRHPLKDGPNRSWRGSPLPFEQEASLAEDSTPLGTTESFGRSMSSQQPQPHHCRATGCQDNSGAASH